MDTPRSPWSYPTDPLESERLLRLATDSALFGALDGYTATFLCGLPRPQNLLALSLDDLLDELVRRGLGVRTSSRLISLSAQAGRLAARAHEETALGALQGDPPCPELLARLRAIRFHLESRLSRRLLSPPLDL